MNFETGGYLFEKKELHWGYSVYGSPRGDYFVSFDFKCNCPGYKYYGKCKHSQLLRDYLKNVEETKRTFEDVFPVAYELSTFLKTKDFISNAIMAGSLRREKKYIKDIDFVVVGNASKTLANMPEGFVKVVAGDKLIRGVYKEIGVDIRFCQQEHFGSMVLYFTGPREFNIGMRSIAKQKGLKLNEYGLFDRFSNELITSEYEVDIFHALGMDYVKPEKRG